MNDAIIYYRSRPSEPEASDLALRLQREAVRADVEAGWLRVLAEFVEEENEASDRKLRERRAALLRAAEGDEPLPCDDGPDETRPAFYAALRAARAHGEACLVIVSHAAIGSGELFETPPLEPGHRPLYVNLSAALVPAPAEILVPEGAPGPLCLYAEFRPGQLDTLIYLCNAGTEPLSAVTVAIHGISMFDFYRSEPEQRWTEASMVSEQRWDILPPGRAVLIDTLDHVIWDMVNRYRVAFRNAGGRVWAAEADSLALNAGRLREDPSQVWVEFPPPWPADRHGEVP